MPFAIRRGRAPLTLLFVLLVAFAASQPARASTPPAGRWLGEIEVPGQPLEVAVTLETGADGSWSGTIDIPAQNARGLPLGGFRIEPPQVEFAIAGVPGAPTFVGALTEDGTAIEGEFRQGGAAFPFRLVTGDDPATSAEAALQGFEAEVAATLERFLVPSVAIAVVAGDQVVLARGYGLRDVEAGAPATGDTLYAIGSATKSFTSALVGALVDEGLAELDRPVWELMPDFRLSEPQRTAAVTVRDLLAHRTGLPRHDLGWYGEPAGLGREELVSRLRHLEANEALRARWQYQNWMYATIGLLAGRLGGSSWEETLQERLLDPLGMARTRLSCSAASGDADLAAPYVENEGDLSRVPCREFPAMAPAGSLYSSAGDMALWVRMQLAGGALGDERILQESTVGELQRTQMILPLGDGGRDREVLARGYALGWFTDVYRGHRRIHHGGNIDGYSALVTLFPDAGVGVVVLANLGGTPAPNVIAWIAADRLLGLEPIDWRARVGERWEAARTAARAADERLAGRRRAGTRPARPLAEYAGEYEHPGYGRFDVELVGDRLMARLHGFGMELDHWHFETFRAEATEEALSGLDLLLQFVADTSGEIVRLEAPLEPLTPPIAFVRRPPARLSDPAFLARLTGAYDVEGAPQVARIELAGDRLRLAIAGQPVWELEPLRGTEFAIVGLAGFTVRFLVDGDEPVDRVEFLQPNGVYSAERVVAP